MKTNLIETWSNRSFEEATMTEEHTWIWCEMINAIDETNLSASDVLDFGCNQGGFLRLLHDLRPFNSGTGVDIARRAVAIAKTLKGNRPITYHAAEDLADLERKFDIAFSHEAIYLVGDLDRHARQMAGALKPGGCYYAVTCCHRDSPLWAMWRARIEEFSNVPVPNHSIADIAGAFRNAGFAVSVRRFLANAFVPFSEPNEYFPTDADRLETYSRWKLMFRFEASG
ncbi:bifunctional 2-polyprenyl-6-hydroxyphenol methylase/3-demethylubiquinol 3-O-methyltransferase UbiG [Roseibium sp. MMSF_3412]|uniref:class I SAM-dependent methyltransferase n=1 Tax=Roseibium sp. MMSF_3412 TaxID=3046712 RepID=UPI0027403051|nr:class I SAM-dependent methyltransferase [Roseibium sp. MMSF_3412]